MSKYNSWIQRNGKKILFVKYSGLSQQQMLEALNEQFEMIEAEPGKVLTFSDFNNSTVNSEFMNAAKTYGKALGDKIEKTALIGINGVKKILLNGYNAFTKNPAYPFETETEAIAFLTKD